MDEIQPTSDISPGTVPCLWAEDETAVNPMAQWDALTDSGSYTSRLVGTANSGVDVNTWRLGTRSCDVAFSDVHNHLRRRNALPRPVEAEVD